MNELVLSDNLAQIELEINHHKQIAGQSIWEIGRRLNHVKENDLAHGQFGKWLDKIGIQYREANRMMTVAKQLPNVTTLSDLGSSALYLIATLPETEKQEQLERIENGDNPTVRELQEVKRQLKLAQADLEEKTAQNERLAELALQKEEPQVIEKEVVKEVYPADYNETIALNQELLDSNKAHYERNVFLENQLKQLSEQREKASKYDDLERAIEQGKGRLSDTQKEIASTKETIAFLKKGNQFLANFGGISYLDIQSVLPKNAQLRTEVVVFASQLKILLDDVNTILNQSTIDILEGDVL